MTSTPPAPPLGGASLECFMLGTRELQTSIKCAFETIVEVNQTIDWDIRIERHEFDEIDVSQLSTQEVEKRLSRSDWLKLELRSLKTFQDIKSSTAIVFYRGASVARVSTLEDMLWGYSGSSEELNLERLNAYVQFCREVADIVAASHVLLGSEPCTMSEFLDMCRRPDSGPVVSPEEAFSTDAVIHLYNWYKTRYLRRWETK